MMAGFQRTEDGLQEDPRLSLTKAVEDASHHSCIQSAALKDKERTLSSLQGELSEIEKKVEIAERELRSQKREILLLEDESDHQPQREKHLQGQCASISKENTELQILISEHEEHARTAEAKFNTYRKKMENHKAAVLVAASQTEAHKELEEKKSLVRMLRQKKEELKKDLENPSGNTVQTAKRENDALKREISLKRAIIAETREKLQNEYEIHEQIKKDIKIQNKRYEAIIKRLCFQLNRVKAARRQMSGDIDHMKRQLAELQRRLEAGVSGR